VSGLQADNHDLIRVKGARENNLKDISVDLPKRRFTAFTGLSGSGKSSLVFHTIAAESQRLINETYSAFLQGMMQLSGRPDVDLLEGLTTAIVVDQERMGANPRSTVGTATDANAMLRIVFSRIGEPNAGSPKAYSFNEPSITAGGAIKVGNKKTVRKKFSVTGGMCPACDGLGQVADIDLTELFDENLSLNEGAIKVPGYTADGWMVKLYSESDQLDGDKPIKKYTKKELDFFLNGELQKIKVSGINRTYEGLIPRIQKSFLKKDREALQPHIRAFVDRLGTFSACAECGGTRLAEGARKSKIDGVSIADACAMQVSDLAEWIGALDRPEVNPLLDALKEVLDAFVDIGLRYLSLDRPSGTLSGGEAQRVKMVGHLGSALTDVTYVFDEPTAGLHPHDIERMNATLKGLRDKGNTVLVVEHNPETIVAADHVVDLGPGAGAAGGEICFEGTVAQLRKSKTLTGKHLDDRAQLKSELRTPTGVIEIRGASANNLQDVDVDIPLGVLTVITGVAGSGKSSLVHGSIPKDAGVVAIDQTPIKGSSRSNPATYTGMFESVRKAFAKASGQKPALFSANSEGACPNCNGAGVTEISLGIMQSVQTTCEVCEGKRFEPSVLDHKLAGKDISEVLALPAVEAVEYFGTAVADVPAAQKLAQRLVDVGLGYIALGQSLSTLSGGERQRLKLATQMDEDADIYLLDEPTTGLHMADVDQLLTMLDRLVDSGKSVIVVAHNQSVMAHADQIIDMGPGAGHDGGRVVFTGTPAELVKKKTLTAKHLAQYVAT
jgi:excinuclease UvrABC ATPase subunit